MNDLYNLYTRASFRRFSTAQSLKILRQRPHVKDPSIPPKPTLKGNVTRFGMVKNVTDPMGMKVGQFEAMVTIYHLNGLLLS